MGRRIAQSMTRTQRRAESSLLATNWREGWGRKGLRDEMILGSVSQDKLESEGTGTEGEIQRM